MSLMILFIYLIFSLSAIGEEDSRKCSEFGKTHKTCQSTTIGHCKPCPGDGIISNGGCFKVDDECPKIMPAWFWAIIFGVGGCFILFITVLCFIGHCTKISVCDGIKNCFCKSSPDRSIQVLCCSSCGRACYCIGIVVVFAFLLPLLIFFAMSAYSFASDSQNQERRTSSGKISVSSANTIKEVLSSEEISEQTLPILFYFLMEYEPNTILSLIFVVPVVVVDILLTMMVLYFRFRFGGYRLSPKSACGLMWLIIFPVIVVDVLELLGFVIGSYLLFVWPIANVLRVFDVAVVLTCRSKRFSVCYKERYDGFFVLCDILGTSAGFFISQDPLWEKIVSLLIEVFDTIFATVYVFAVNGSALSVSALHVFSFMKICIVSLNVSLGVKNYLWFGSYLCSAITGAVFGVLVFMPLLVLLIVSIYSKSLVIVVYFMIPLLVAIFLVSVIVLICGGSGVKPDETVFYKVEADDNDDGNEMNEP